MNEPVDRETGAPLITLRLSTDEARWLVTAVTITQRLLEGLHLHGHSKGSTIRFADCVTLHRIADRLTSGLVGSTRGETRSRNLSRAPACRPHWRNRCERGRATRSFRAAESPREGVIGRR